MKRFEPTELATKCVEILCLGLCYAISCYHVLYILQLTVLLLSLSRHDYDVIQPPYIAVIFNVVYVDSEHLF